MKQKLLALVCALALVVSLAGCVISTPDTVGSLGDYEISSGLYLLAQYDAYQKAADLASSDQDAANVKAFLKQTITVDSDSGETATVSDYVARKTLENLQTYAATELRFDELGGQLTAQLVKAQLSGGVGLQVLQRFPGDIIADGGRLAAVAVHGDGLLQKSLHIGGVLVGGSEVGGFLVGVVLGQQIQAGGDLVIAEGTHGVRGGDDTACQADHQGQRANQCKKFLFHSWLLLKFIFGFSQAWARLKSRPWP